MTDINGHKFQPHWGEEKLCAIAAAYGAGDSAKDICRRFRCSKQFIRTVRDAFGLPKRAHGGAWRHRGRVDPCAN